MIIIQLRCTKRPEKQRPVPANQLFSVNYENIYVKIPGLWKLFSPRISRVHPINESVSVISQSEILHNDGARHISPFRRFTTIVVLSPHEELAFLKEILKSLNVEIVESFCF